MIIRLVLLPRYCPHPHSSFSSLFINDAVLGSQLRSSVQPRSVKCQHLPLVLCFFFSWSIYQLNVGNSNFYLSHKYSPELESHFCLPIGLLYMNCLTFFLISTSFCTKFTSPTDFCFFFKLSRIVFKTLNHRT